MKYKVRIKEPGVFKRWKVYKNVVGDLCLEYGRSQFLPMRVLILEDETRIEVPMTFMLEFSPERAKGICKKMKKESGQDIQVIDHKDEEI